MMGGFWGMGSPLVVSYLAPLAGRGRTLREAESPGEGYRSIVRSRFAEGAPHPDPLRASFARLDPAQERGEGAPVPRGDEDRDLGELCGKDRVETQLLAKPRGVPRHLRAVEPGHHRRRWGAALA